MRVYPIIGVAVVAILIGVGLFYMQPRPTNPVAYEPSTTTASASGGSQNAAFRVLDAGTQAVGVTAQKNYAAYSEESFIKLWDMVHGADKAMPPNVNFSTEYVIGVFAGEKPTGGYSIAVSSVTDEGTTRTVSITLAKPGPGCATSQAVTSPYQIIAVPTSDAVLQHADTEVSTPCN